MIIIYCDSLTISRKTFKSFQAKFLSKKLVFIHSLYFTNIPYSYPQNIKWHQFPYIQEPEFKIKPIEQWIVKTPFDDSLIPIDITMEDIITSEKIIYAGDPSYKHSYFFKIFIKKVFNKNVQDIHIDSLFLISLVRENIDATIENMENFYTMFKDTLNYGEVVKYFDYNFNFNSFALLSRVYKYSNDICNNREKENDTSNVFISKYMIQLLYFVNKNIEPKTYGELIHHMQNWTGTGKHSNNAWLGSPTSCSTIIDNLMELNLINKKESSNSSHHKIYLTEKGKHFLNSLPKDCQDLDLPFRIKLWAEQPFEESKIKIDTYLNNYFKKIKNKINLLDIKY